MMRKYYVLGLPGEDYRLENHFSTTDSCAAHYISARNDGQLCTEAEASGRVCAGQDAYGTWNHYSPPLREIETGHLLSFPTLFQALRHFGRFCVQGLLAFGKENY